MSEADPLLTPAPEVDRAWLHEFAMTTRMATLSTLEPVNTCIFTTRIGVAVLDRFNVTARAMPVYVAVHNLEAWRLAEQRVPIAEWPDSAHSVGIDETDRLATVSGWNGHLVLIVKLPGKPRTLIDLTADQFDRPARNLVVGGPVFMDITPGAMWSPRDPLHTTVGRSEDGPDLILTYRPMPPGNPAAQRWRDTSDWKTPADIVEDYVTEIVTRLG